MNKDFDLDKLLKSLPPTPGDTKSPLTSDMDDFLETEAKKKQTRRSSQHKKDDRNIKELESDLSKIDAIDAKIKLIDGKAEDGLSKLSKLFFERVILQCKILMSGANIPEANAEKYYSELNTIYKVIAEKLPQNQEFLKDLSKSINLAYAFYYKSQSDIYTNQFENAIEDSDKYFYTYAAAELAGKILLCAAKALGLYEQLHDLGTIAVEIGAGYEVYKDSIITSRSADNSVINIRVDTRQHVINSLLEKLIRYNTALQKIDKAKEFNEKLEKLDIGYRIKQDTDYSESYKKKLEQLDSEYGVQGNSYVSHELERWHKYWQEEQTGISSTDSRGFRFADLPDFVKLVITAIAVLIIIVFFLSILMRMGL